MPLVSSLKEANPFESFFQDPLYLELKNHLYNYLRRKEEIRFFLRKYGAAFPLVEIGAGVSPMAEPSAGVIFTDPSEGGMRHLRKWGPAARYMTMSATSIPLKSGTVSTIICSEVLEHIPDDALALSEMARVLRPGGLLILTVPAHSYYFSHDDRFVKHERRYEPETLAARLRDLGFDRPEVSKVAGFLEKITMLGAVAGFRLFKRVFRSQNTARSSSHPVLRFFLPLYRALNRLYAVLVKWEAKIMPLSVSSIVLICGKKAES